MAMRVPTYERKIKTGSVQFQTPQAPGVTTPGVVQGAFGENLAQANQSLAKAGEKLADYFLQKAKDNQDIEVLRRETISRQTTQGKISDPETETFTDEAGNTITRPKGFLNRQLGKAKGVTEEFDNYYYNELRPATLKGLSKYQFAKLAPAMDNYYASTRGNIISHEAYELEKYNMEETKANHEQKVLDASLVRDVDQLKYAIDDDAKSSSTFLSKFGEQRRKIFNQTMAGDIVDSAVISTLNSTNDVNFTQSLLDGVKDKIPLSTYNKLKLAIETGGEQIQQKIEKINQENQALQLLTLNKDEDDLVKMKIAGTLTDSAVRDYLNANRIRPKFADTMISALNSPDTVSAKTDIDTYFHVMEMINNPDAKAADIRDAIFEGAAKGKLTTGDVKSLYGTKKPGADSTVFQDYEAQKAWYENPWKSHPFKAAWALVTFHFPKKEDARDRVEVMNTIVGSATTANTTAPEQVAKIANDEINRKLIQNNPNRSKYAIDEIINTPKGAVKVIGYDKDGEPIVQQVKK